MMKTLLPFNSSPLLDGSMRIMGGVILRTGASRRGLNSQASSNPTDLSPKMCIQQVFQVQFLLKLFFKHTLDSNRSVGKVKLEKNKFSKRASPIDPGFPTFNSARISRQPTLRSLLFFTLSDQSMLVKLNLEKYFSLGVC